MVVRGVMLVSTVTDAYMSAHNVGIGLTGRQRQAGASSG